MQQLEQRINFYQDIFRKPEIRFPFEQVIGVAAVVLALLLVVTVLDFVRTQSQRNQVAHLQLSQTRMQTAVQQMQEQVAKLVADPALEKQEIYLRETLNGKQQFLAALKQQGDTHQMHFSGVLEGLANMDVKSLWLTRIQVRAPGPELSLDGLAAEPRALPDYLAALHQESVFDGMQFRMLTLERKEDRSRYLTFSVSTHHAENAQR